jgi:hypothetical protein
VQTLSALFHEQPDAAAHVVDDVRLAHAEVVHVPVAASQVQPDAALHAADVVSFQHAYATHWSPFQAQPAGVHVAFVV